MNFGLRVSVIVSALFPMPTYGQTTTMAVPASPMRTDSFILPPGEVSAQSYPTTSAFDGSSADSVPSRRLWFEGEFLLYWMKGYRPFALAAVVSPTVNLDEPRPPLGSAAILYPPDDGIQFNNLPGWRLGGGFHYNESVGGDVAFFRIEQTSRSASYASSGLPILARPIIDPFDPQVITYFIYTRPDRNQVGAIIVNATSEVLGGDVDLRVDGVAFMADRFQWLLGFRYLELNDRLRIDDLFGDTAGTFGYTSYDQFATVNQFYGPQIGGTGHYSVGRFTADWTFKVGVGVMRQKAMIDGRTAQLGFPDLPASLPGGLLALPTNIGNYSRSETVVIPEVKLNFGYRITPYSQVFLGYNFTYVSSVLRPNGVMDPVVNPTYLPYTDRTPLGAVRPQLPWNTDSFWLQGLNLGLSIEF